MSLTPACREFTARLGLQLPLVQAPMAGFQSGALASAVCGVMAARRGHDAAGAA